MASVQCEMRANCPNEVTHIGSKGYVYCAACAPDRQGIERTRKMRPWELKLIQAGKPLPTYKPISKRAAVAATEAR